MFLGANTTMLPVLCRRPFRITSRSRTSSPFWAWTSFPRTIRLPCTARVRSQKFLSQPFTVTEVFTGFQGKFVSVKDTVSGFKGILEGKYDHLPESAFYMVGDINEVVAKAAKLAAELEAQKSKDDTREVKKDAKAGGKEKVQATPETLANFTEHTRKVITALRDSQITKQPQKKEEITKFWKDWEESLPGELSTLTEKLKKNIVAFEEEKKKKREEAAARAERLRQEQGQ